MNPAQRLLIGLIRLYKLVLSPWLGRQCRFLPTCSEYGKEAIEKHGALKGSWLTACRIGRCRPGCAHGYDPVPPVAPSDATPPGTAPPDEKPGR